VVEFAFDYGIPNLNFIIGIAMNPRVFLTRIIALAVIAAITAATGGITASILGAAGISLLISLPFTSISERVIRGKLFGKIGGNILVWWLMHIAYETVTFGALLWLCAAVFGVHIGTTWIAVVAGLISWMLLSGEAMKTALTGIAMLLAWRK
jgi:hypothetical protein